VVTACLHCFCVGKTRRDLLVGVSISCLRFLLGVSVCRCRRSESATPSSRFLETLGSLRPSLVPLHAYSLSSLEQAVFATLSARIQYASWTDEEDIEGL
jgi:hypothetical protein